MPLQNNAMLPSDAVTCGMQKKIGARERLERLKAQLALEVNNTDRCLLKKLEACGAAQSERYRCRTPACFRCRCINQRKQQRETASYLGHFKNDDLVWVTVVHGATSHIDGLSSLIKKGRQDTRNCFVSARRRDPRWNGTHLMAWHEIDAVGAEHLPLLPPKRKSLVPLLAPMAAETSSPTWVPTWHGLMWTNGLSANEIKVQFGRQWKHEHQVDVQMLDLRKSLQANLSYLSAYANKFQTTVSLDSKVTEPWPITWEAKFFGWIDAAQRNPFESLRMSVRQHVPEVKLEVCRPVEVLSPMPFTHSFTSVPMHNNTGAWA